MNRTPKEESVSIAPLIAQSLAVGENSVNFDDSMRQFVELTQVRFPAMRRAAKDVQKAVDELGLGSGQPTHAYLRFVNKASTETFATGTVLEMHAGSTCINQMIFCFGISIRRDLTTTQQGMEKVIVSGASQTDIKLPELLQFYVVDQLSHEFAHAFGIRPGEGRLKDIGVDDVEKIADAVAIWAIPPGDSRANRKLIFTGFNRLQNSYHDSNDLPALDRVVRTVAEDTLNHYKLLP